MLRVVWVFIKKDFLTYTSYRLQVLLMLWGVALVFAHFIFLGKMVGSGAGGVLDSYGGRYFPFVVLGIAFAHYFDLALNGLAQKIREAQTLGTLEAILITRAGTAALLVGLVAFQFIFTSLFSVVYLAISVAIADLTITATAVVGTVVFFALTVFAFLGFGMLSAAFILVFKRGEPVAWAVQGLSYLLSGVYYPVSILPEPLQVFAKLLPLTHAMEGVRRLWLSGAALPEVLPQVLALVAFGVVLIPLGIWGFRKALVVARREGTLAQF